MKRKVWTILLAIFLLLYAVFTMTNLQMEFERFVMGAFAIGTSIFLFLDR